MISLKQEFAAGKERDTHICEYGRQNQIEDNGRLNAEYCPDCAEHPVPEIIIYIQDAAGIPRIRGGYYGIVDYRDQKSMIHQFFAVAHGRVEIPHLKHGDEEQQKDQIP